MDHFFNFSQTALFLTAQNGKALKQHGFTAISAHLMTGDFSSGLL